MAHYLVIYGIVSLVSAVLAMLVAKLKKRSADGWGFTSFLLPPALLILLLLPKNKNIQQEPELSEKDIRKIRDSMWD